jgi:hypothetical protein
MSLNLRVFKKALIFFIRLTIVAASLQKTIGFVCSGGHQGDANVGAGSSFDILLSRHLILKINPLPERRKQKKRYKSLRNSCNLKAAFHLF